ncbi:MAG: hypothetical protein NVS3B21_01030 [Acidimicrobiales bacterium]
MPRHRTDPDERGVIIILSSILALALLTFTAFSVDIGHESDVKRHLHVVADLAAEDALYALGTPSSMNDAVTLAVASASGNGHPLTGSNQLSVELGRWTGSPLTFVAFAPTPCVVSLPGGTVPTCTAAATANAVRVIASNSLIWNFVSGSQGLSATAIAHPDGFTGLEVGTFDASASLTASQQTLLNGELGITGVSYDGLAGASIKLGDLATQLGFASPDDLLKAKVAYKDLTAAAARALSSTGDTGAAASMGCIAQALASPAPPPAAPLPAPPCPVGATTTSSAGAGAGAAGSALIDMGELYNSTSSGSGTAVFGGGAAVAGAAGIDALGLITAGLDTAVIDGTGFASLNNVNLAIANVSTVDAGVKVLKAPNVGFGFGCNATIAEPADSQTCAQARSSQVEGQLTAHLAPMTLNIVGVGTATITSNIPLYFDNAGAHTWVSFVSCSSPFDHQANVDAWARTGLAHLVIGQNTGFTASTNQQNYTAGVSGSLSVPGPDGVAVAVNGAAFANISIPAIGINVNVANNGAVTVLDSGPVLAQPPATTPPVPSYSGPFLKPTSALPSNSLGYRGPDRVTSKQYANGLALTPPLVGPTGNGVTDGLGALASQLPPLQPPLDAAMAAAGTPAATQTLVDAALNVPLTTELSTIQSVLGMIDATVLAPLSAAFQASLAGAVVTNLATRHQTPPDGTVCVPRIVG